MKNPVVSTEPQPAVAVEVQATVRVLDIGIEMGNERVIAALNAFGMPGVGEQDGTPIPYRLAHATIGGMYGTMHVCEITGSTVAGAAYGFDDDPNRGPRWMTMDLTGEPIGSVELHVPQSLISLVNEWNPMCRGSHESTKP